MTEENEKEKKIIKLISYPSFDVLEIIIPPVIDVNDAKKILENQIPIDETKPLFISGRGPIWLHSALVHKYGHSCVAAFQSS